MENDFRIKKINEEGRVTFQKEGKKLTQHLQRNQTCRDNKNKT